MQVLYCVWEPVPVHGRNLISDGSKSDKLPRENLILDGSKSDKLLRENPSSIMQTVCNYFSTYNPQWLDRYIIDIFERISGDGIFVWP